MVWKAKVKMAFQFDPSYEGSHCKLEYEFKPNKQQNYVASIAQVVMLYLSNLAIKSSVL
jgi:hypothetical protein